MWTENKIYAGDLSEAIEDSNIPWRQLRGKTILITGAAGLIGATVTDLLLYANKQKGLGLSVIGLVHNLQKAEKKFSTQLEQGLPLRLEAGDVCQWQKPLGDISYIIHCASQTASHTFVEQPIETIRTAIQGTENMLRQAYACKAEGFVYLSSMEVYGAPDSDVKISENYANNLDTMSVRNCYPISKRMCENVCRCYTSEYGLSTQVIRLTQTFGPGVCYEDGRVFAEFARCSIENRDIVLHTLGQTKRNYLYTMDAARAILTVMLKGRQGSAYNAANEKTYCSIFDMAHFVADELTGGKISVRCENDTESAARGYAPILKMNLDATRLAELGWKPQRDLRQMFENMIAVMREDSNE